MASSRKTPTLCERDTRQLRGTNLIHPLARDIKDTLLTRKKQVAEDSDSNSLLGVLLLACHQGKLISTIFSFSSGNQNNYT